MPARDYIKYMLFASAYCMVSSKQTAKFKKCSEISIIPLMRSSFKWLNFLIYSNCVNQISMSSDLKLL